MEQLDEMRSRMDRFEKLLENLIVIQTSQNPAIAAQLAPTVSGGTSSTIVEPAPSSVQLWTNESQDSTVTIPATSQYREPVLPAPVAPQTLPSNKRRPSRNLASSPLANLEEGNAYDQFQVCYRSGTRVHLSSASTRLQAHSSSTDPRLSGRVEVPRSQMSRLHPGQLFSLAIGSTGLVTCRPPSESIVSYTTAPCSTLRRSTLHGVSPWTWTDSCRISSSAMSSEPLEMVPRRRLGRRTTPLSFIAVFSSWAYT
jgi:hypothetical protein